MLQITKVIIHFHFSLGNIEEQLITKSLLFTMILRHFMAL